MVKRIKKRVKEMEIDQWINEYKEFLFYLKKQFPEIAVEMSDREWKNYKKQLMKVPREKWLDVVTGSDLPELFDSSLITISLLIKTVKYDTTSPRSVHLALKELEEVYDARNEELINADSKSERRRKLQLWLACDMMNIASVLAIMAISLFNDDEEQQDLLMGFYQLIPLDIL